MKPAGNVELNQLVSAVNRPCDRQTSIPYNLNTFRVHTSYTNLSPAIHEKFCLSKQVKKWLKWIGICIELSVNFRTVLIWCKIQFSEFFKAKYRFFKDLGLPSLENKMPVRRSW